MISSLVVSWLKILLPELRTFSKVCFSLLSDILLEEHKNLNHIKIIDFGEAVISPADEKLTEIAGTMAYVSAA